MEADSLGDRLGSGSLLVGLGKPAGGGGTFLFEGARASQSVGQPNIVENSCDVENLGVVIDAVQTSPGRGPGIAPL